MECPSKEAFAMKYLVYVSLVKQIKIILSFHILKHFQLDQLINLSNNVKYLQITVMMNSKWQEHSITNLGADDVL